MTNQSNRTIIRRKLVRKTPLKEQSSLNINTNVKKIIRKKIIRKPTQIIETKQNQQQTEPINETPTIRKRIIKKRIKKTKNELNTQEIKPEIINTHIQTSNQSFLNQIFDDLTTDEDTDEQTNENEPNKDDLSNQDVETVLVVNWNCSHYQRDYLLDPITQEVFCKKTRDLIGVRYKNDDELSLIDFN